ncbi:hypothetical protein WR25_26910 [Diploscapter pachys]|uniref:GATA-type domain-containing protein n=1 Tax=Diploscapter pachys TaxID=2018661 RepID=A0A2A2JIS4_9BILA|nr:hypothetical protein WR25_26910 [Diploscapter pachys]
MSQELDDLFNVDFLGPPPATTAIGQAGNQAPSANDDVTTAYEVDHLDFELMFANYMTPCQTMPSSGGATTKPSNSQAKKTSKGQIVQPATMPSDSSQMWLQNGTMNPQLFTVDQQRLIAAQDDSHAIQQSTHVHHYGQPTCSVSLTHTALEGGQPSQLLATATEQAIHRNDNSGNLYYTSPSTSFLEPHPRKSIDLSLTTTTITKQQTVRTVIGKKPSQTPQHVKLPIKRRRLTKKPPMHANSKCTVCGTNETPMWRHHSYTGKLECNACNQYFEKYGVPRPASLHNRVVVKRVRNHTKFVKPVFVQLENQFVDIETVKGEKYGGPHLDTSKNCDNEVDIVGEFPPINGRIYLKL